MSGNEESLYQLGLSCRMGLRRKNNEDNYYLNGLYKPLELLNSTMELSSSAQDHVVAAVSDGLGGGSYGEYAAWLAVRTVGACFGDWNSRQPLSRQAEDCIARIHQQILREGQRRDCQMGCTLALAVIRGRLARIYNIGDSRIYLSPAADGRLQQLSRDHTVEQELLDMGVRRRTDRGRERKGGLTQYLGMPEEDVLIQPHMTWVQLNRGDSLLLCSDGVTDMLSEEEIARLLSDGAPPNVQALRLSRAAEKAGGRDNITALVLRAE